MRIQEIENDLDLLRRHIIYEVEHTPGTVSCAKLADRIADNLKYVIYGYKKMIDEKK